MKNFIPINIIKLLIIILTCIYFNSCGSSADPCDDYYQTACQKINSCNSAISYDACMSASRTLGTAQCIQNKPILLTIDCNTLICMFATVNQQYTQYCQ